MPVEAVRDALRKVLEASPWWDGRVCRLQVTDATERVLELRALVSAANPSDLWELRCEVRVALVGELQRGHPHTLPRVRLEGEALQPSER